MNKDLTSATAGEKQANDSNLKPWEKAARTQKIKAEQRIETFLVPAPTGYGWFEKNPAENDKRKRDLHGHARIPGARKKHH